MPRVGPGKTVKGAAGIVALLALVAIASGCGGGSDGPSEAALREKLATAAQKLTEAKSFRVAVLLEAAESGVAEKLGCIAFAVDKHGDPERVEVDFYEEECEEGPEPSRLVAVGRHAWVSSRYASDAWRAGTIAPSVLRELDDERTDLGGLMKAAEDIGRSSEEATVEEEPGIYADVPVYEFEAPGSAFPADEGLEDVDLNFRAAIDRKGFLRELVLVGAAEGTFAGVTEKYTSIDEPLFIRPPDPSEVRGKVTAIDTQSDLDRLLGALTP